MPGRPSVQMAAASGPGTVQVLHLPSADSDRRTRDVWVYRPPGPDSSNLPVLWFLHGLPGGPGDVFDAGLAQAMDGWIASGGSPFVVAAPDGNGNAHPDTEWADSVDGADRVESFIVKVAIPAVEGSQARDRDHRGIAGFSMGGYGAANLGLRHPELFSQVVSLDGYFHIDDPSGVFAGDGAAMAANSPDQHPDRARALRTMLDDGRSDKVPLTEGESTRFKGLLDGAGAFSDLVLPQGDHSWRFVSSQFFAMQGFLNASWRCYDSSDPATSALWAASASTPRRSRSHRRPAATATGYWPATAVCSPSVTPPSTGRRAPCASTRRSWPSPPRAAEGATGWWRPTAGCSPSATRPTTAPPPGPASPAPSCPWLRPGTGARATGSCPPTGACSPSSPLTTGAFRERSRATPAPPVACARPTRARATGP